MQTLQIQENILRKCNQRENELTRSVQGRLQSCNDLVAEEAVYYRACYQKFLSGDGESNPVGCPVNPDSSSAFDKLCLWLESEASTDLLTLSELQSKMEEFSESKETYSTKWLKKKLQDRYCNHLYFAQVSGRKNVCFKNMVNYIINEQWYKKCRNNVEDEAKRIVATAAKLIREKIRNLNLSMECYPSREDITDSVDENSRWMPYLLSTFLSYLVPDTGNRASMCQCIIKSSRLRTALPPLLFGLGIECDHIFGSKWLVNELYRPGFSISYSEVSRF